MSLTPENKQRIKNVNDALKERGIRWPKTDEWQDESLGKRKKMQEILSYSLIGTHCQGQFTLRSGETASPLNDAMAQGI